MSNINTILSSAPPRTLDEALANWPDRGSYTPSPADWRDQFFYFLLPDRFSNGQERPDRVLDVDLSTNVGRTRIQCLRGANWQWNLWQQSGADRFQGGTIQGIRSKLDYLSTLNVTTLWIAPVFRQRVEENTYHGYGIQNFLDVDPRFGTRRDLFELVQDAHAKGIYVILDIIFNHSGCNWLYDQSAGDPYKPAYLPSGGYEPIWPRNGMGGAIFNPGQHLGADDYVLPLELQGKDAYLRAGHGDLKTGNIDDPLAEHKRTDFECLRKFNLFNDNTLSALMLIYQYWIALADLDGFRIDTFKHVSLEQARNFSNAIKEYAEDRGKNDFFLVAEVAGGSSAQDRYLDITGRNLSACLDIGEQLATIDNVGKGLQPAGDFFAGFDYYDMGMGSHRNWGSRHLSISCDHDRICSGKVRVGADAANDHQNAAVLALQLFALGIPCIYYGTEQGLAGGAENCERKWLKKWGEQDELLRETMFGPLHPRASGWAGTQGQQDSPLPGFGPHGTVGWHVFNENHPIYTRIAQMAAIRRKFKPLRRGRQYRRSVSFLGYPFGFYGSGELIAWSRVFDDQEVLVIVNPHGNERRGQKVAVDLRLCGKSKSLHVIANTDPAFQQMRVGNSVPVQTDGSTSFIELENCLLGPSEVLVLANESALKAAQ